MENAARDDVSFSIVMRGRGHVLSMHGLVPQQIATGGAPLIVLCTRASRLGKLACCADVCSLPLHYGGILMRCDVLCGRAVMCCDVLCCAVLCCAVLCCAGPDIV
jgi:hypothetical protein